MVKSSPKFPSPLKTLGNSLHSLRSVATIVAANFSVVIAGRPSSFSSAFSLHIHVAEFVFPCSL